jgi:hypothetical protein
VPRALSLYPLYWGVRPSISAEAAATRRIEPLSPLFRSDSGAATRSECQHCQFNSIPDIRRGSGRSDVPSTASGMNLPVHEIVPMQADHAGWNG